MEVGADVLYHQAKGAAPVGIAPVCCPLPPTYRTRRLLHLCTITPEKDRLRIPARMLLLRTVAQRTNYTMEASADNRFLAVGAGMPEVRRLVLSWLKNNKTLICLCGSRVSVGPALPLAGRSLIFGGFPGTFLTVGCLSLSRPCGDFISSPCRLHPPLRCCYSS